MEAVLSQTSSPTRAVKPHRPASATTPASKTVCRKVLIQKGGSYERLEFTEGPLPEAGVDEVLIEVHAAGVNYADAMVRMGLYRSAKEFVGWPVTPGFEVAGVVVAIGENVEHVKPGDRVFAVTLFGGYASHLAVPAHYVFPIPDGISMIEAAGVPAVFLSAYYALFELAHPRKNARVLVHSAAGGVGGSLVQLLKVIGAEVVGVVGASHKVEVAKRLGADHVIDKSVEDLWSTAEQYAPQGYDVVLDANGVATLKDSYRHLRPAGKLVVYGFHTMIPRTGGRANWVKLAADYFRTPRFNPLDMTNESKSVLAFNLSYLFDRTDILTEAMDHLAGWFAERRIVAPPVTTYPIERVADAHRDIESAQTVGKLVLTFR